MKLNKKGTTIVELVVSVSMLFVIAVFLFQIIISLKEVYNYSGIKTEMLNKQAVISKMINDDLRKKKLEIALSCNNDGTCLSLYFADGTSKNLELIPKNDENKTAYFVYGDYKTELVSGSNYDFSIDSNERRKYEIKSETILNATGLNNSILYIHIGIKHPLLKNEDFGINVTYQYNDKTTSIPALELSADSTSISNFYLLGNSTMIGYTSVDFVDPGYFYLDENQNFVKVTGTDDNYSYNDYVSITDEMINENTKQITYISRINGEILATRTVKYINTIENFEYNGAYHEFRAPVSGTYNIELWGANGGSTVQGTGGIGAYTSGNIKLTAGEKVYVYVGGAPSGDNGGYNGGGSITAHQSENGGAAGGGATDVRLESGNWNYAEGLKSRIMVAAGGGAAKTAPCGSIVSTGGHGGTLTSDSPDVGTSCENNIWTLSGGATQNAGGTLRIYTNGTASSPYQAGAFGMAGSASQFSGDIVSGGGGGYYGGANAGYGSFATGGSSFISGCENCIAITSNGTPADNSIHYSGKYFTNYKMVAGNSISSNPNITKPANNNNGYARIKLVSVTYGDEYYPDGTVVYYNPITNNTCNNYVSANSDTNYKGETTSTQNGCMKWHTFLDKGGSSVKLILDHNTASKIKWNDDNINVIYENSNIYSSVQQLITTSGWNSSLKPTIITAEEVSEIVEYQKVKNTDFTNTSDWFYLDSKDHTRTNTSQGTSNYAWLFNNLGWTDWSCTSYGCNSNNTNEGTGYWTKTTYDSASSGTRIWHVNGYGTIDHYVDANKIYNGIRPVITVPKAKLR